MNYTGVGRADERSVFPDEWYGNFGGGVYTYGMVNCAIRSLTIREGSMLGGLFPLIHSIKLGVLSWLK